VLGIFMAGQACRVCGQLAYSAEIEQVFRLKASSLSGENEQAIR
jgi:hypothetical protein